MKNREEDIKRIVSKKLINFPYTRPSQCIEYGFVSALEFKPNRSDYKPYPGSLIEAYCKNDDEPHIYYYFSNGVIRKMDDINMGFYSMDRVIGWRYVKIDDIINDYLK